VSSFTTAKVSDPLLTSEKAENHSAGLHHGDTANITLATKVCIVNFNKTVTN